MGDPKTGQDAPHKQEWEEELVADHRWGRHGERALAEPARLRGLWSSARPLNEVSRGLVGSIIGLEICNWNLEESILHLCGAIGRKEPASIPIGHGNWHAEDRVKRVWAYYLTCRHWLVGAGRTERPTGYQVLLRACDPDNSIQDRVLGLLGEQTALKALYVERFCRCLEYWIGDCRGRESPQTKAHAAAVASLEDEIRRQDPESEILNVFRYEGDGGIPTCHHKLFRRYEIILSSIGTGKWRGGMPVKGTSPGELAATVEPYLAAMESWAQGATAGRACEETQLSDQIHRLLGSQDSTKVFLVSLLASLLRAQQPRG